MPSRGEIKEISGYVGFFFFFFNECKQENCIKKI